MSNLICKIFGHKWDFYTNSNISRIESYLGCYSGKICERCGFDYPKDIKKVQKK